MSGCGYYDVCERGIKGAQWITRGCSYLTTFDSKSKSCRDPRVAICYLGNFH